MHWEYDCLYIYITNMGYPPSCHPTMQNMNFQAIECFLFLYSNFDKATSFHVWTSLVSGTYDVKPWFLSLSYSFPLNLPLSQSYGDAIHRGRPWKRIGNIWWRPDLNRMGSGLVSQSSLFFGLKMDLGKPYERVYSEVPVGRNARAAFFFEHVTFSWFLVYFEC